MSQPAFLVTALILALASGVTVAKISKVTGPAPSFAQQCEAKGGQLDRLGCEDGFGPVLRRDGKIEEMRVERCEPICVLPKP